MRYPKEKQTTEAKALAPPEIGSFTTVVNTYFKSNILAKAARPLGAAFLFLRLASLQRV